MQLIRRASFLTSSQIVSYNKNGFLFLPNMIPLTDIAVVKRRAYEHIESWKPNNHPIFTTNDQSRVSDEYFFKSAYNISFFFEESVKPPIKDKHASINKIGHALHDLDPEFRNFSYRNEFKSILTDLGYVNPQIVQSMYIVKAPRVGGEVKAHQDSTYIISEPSSCTGIWIALEDAEMHNACLYAVPGSHKNGNLVLWERKKEGMVYTNQFEYHTKDAVCLEAKAGTVVILNGDLVHWSEQNYSEKSRHAYTLHCVEGNYKWSEKNWIQRPDYFPFRIWE